MLSNLELVNPSSCEPVTQAFKAMQWRFSGLKWHPFRPRCTEFMVQYSGPKRLMIQSMIQYSDGLSQTLRTLPIIHTVLYSLRTQTLKTTQRRSLGYVPVLTLGLRLNPFPFLRVNWAASMGTRMQLPANAVKLARARRVELGVPLR